VSEFRWLLAAAGVLILLLVFWLSRREFSGRPRIDTGRLLRRRMPSLQVPAAGESPAGEGEAASGTPVTPPATAASRIPDKIVAVRLTGRGTATFAGDALVLALRDAGLRHGRFGIFHRCDPADESRIIFSVASLGEPGSFDLTRIKSERLPGVSLFMTLPGPADSLAAFDDMLATAHALAMALEGELLDEQGSRLSVQRERFLREEVIQLQHRLPSP